MLAIQLTTLPQPPAILLVDDNPGVLYSTSKILVNHQFRVATASNADQALGQVKAGFFDLVVCDINMPGRSGLDFLNDLKRYDPTIASIIITANGTVGMAIQAMKSGALGFVTKPFKEHELLETIETALEQSRLVRETLQMEVYTPMLESLCNALLNTMEANEFANEGGPQRVARYAQAVAQAVGLPPEQVSQVYMAGLFHDIGKIGVPDSILRKTGPLTREEQAEMIRHPELGARIIEQAHGMDQAATIVRHHHERYDGKGYPDGMAEEEIPVGSRIVAVVDSYEEMTRQRLYAPGRGHAEAIAELERNKGTQFDPKIVEAAIPVLNADPNVG